MSEVNIDNRRTKLVTPYEDTYIGPFTLCPKEVILNGYLDKIGKNISFSGVSMKVISVTVTEKQIIVELD
jgi:hypothetical protein